MHNALLIMRNELSSFPPTSPFHSRTCYLPRRASTAGISVMRQIADVCVCAQYRNLLNAPCQNNQRWPCCSLEQVVCMCADKQAAKLAPPTRHRSQLCWEHAKLSVLYLPWSLCSEAGTPRDQASGGEPIWQITPHWLHYSTVAGPTPPSKMFHMLSSCLMLCAIL